MWNKIKLICKFLLALWVAVGFGGGAVSILFIFLNNETTAMICLIPMLTLTIPAVIIAGVAIVEAIFDLL